jgi:hypothetical protein
LMAKISNNYDDWNLSQPQRQHQRIGE